MTAEVLDLIDEIDNDPRHGADYPQDGGLDCGDNANTSGMDTSVETILALYFILTLIICIVCQVKIQKEKRFWLVSMALFVLAILLIKFDISGQMAMFLAELRRSAISESYGWNVVFLLIPFILTIEISFAYILIRDYIRLPYNFSAIFVTSLFYNILVYAIWIFYTLLYDC